MDPWPPELIRRVGLANIVKLRRMDRDQATELLDREVPGLSDYERELVLSITDNVAPEPEYEPESIPAAPPRVREFPEPSAAGTLVFEEARVHSYNRRHKMITLRFIGASQTRVADLFGIKRGTMQALERRALGKMQVPRFPYVMSREDLSTYAHIYDNNAATLLQLHPADAAHWIREHNAQID